MASADDEYANRILKELRSYFQGDFSDDLAKAVSKLPDQAKSYHDQMLKQVMVATKEVEDLKKILVGLDRAAQIMLQNGRDTADAIEDLSDAIRTGGTGGGGGGAPVTAASPSAPGKPPGPDGSEEKPYWVELTKGTIELLTNELRQKLESFVQGGGHGGGGGGEGGGAKAAEPKRTSGNGVADAAQDISFRNAAVDADTYDRLRELIYGKYNKTKKRWVDNLFDQVETSAKAFVSRKISEVLLAGVQQASDIVSGKRALDELAFYAKTSFDSSSKQFTGFADSIVNDFQYIFGNSGILAEHAIKLMEQLNQKGSLAFAFQSGNAYQFAGDIRKMRLTMEETRDGQDSLFKYFTDDQQNVILGGVFDQLVSAGVTQNLSDQKVIEAARQQYDVMKSISESTGASLDELILANKKNPELDEVMARLTKEGWSTQQLAQFRGLYDEMSMVDPASAQNILKIGLDSATQGLLALQDNGTGWADGSNAAQIGAVNKIRRGTSESTQDLVRGIGEGIDTSGAGYVPDWAGVALTNQKRAMADKEGPAKYIEEMVHQFGAMLNNSPLKPVATLVSAVMGSLKATEALTYALWANTAAQSGGFKLFGSFFKNFKSLFGGAAWKGTGVVGGKGIVDGARGVGNWLYTSKAARMIAKTGGTITGIMGIATAFQGIFSDERQEAYKKQFADIGNETERKSKETTAQITGGILTALSGVLPFLGPFGLIASAVIGVGNMFSSMLTGADMFEWIGIGVAKIQDSLMAAWKWFGDGIGHVIGFLNPFDDAPSTAKAASYVSPQTSIAATQQVSTQLAETAANQNKISSWDRNVNGTMMETLKGIRENTGAGAVASANTASLVRKTMSPAYSPSE